MSLWDWYRARRLWLKIVLPLVAAPVLLALGYVAVRSLQYATAEKDPGFYVPAKANVVIRAKDLEGHVARLQKTLAWQSIQRKVLRDATLRPLISGLLKANGGPTLDELEDERLMYARKAPLLLDLLGLDAVAALSAGPLQRKPELCGIVRLKWLYYLATPFARFVLPTESIGGATVLRVEDFYVAFEGALVLASDSKALLEDALRRKGQEDASAKPLGVRVAFEGSPTLLELRRQIRDSGLMPYVQWDTTRAMVVHADLDDANLKLTLSCPGATPIVAAASPAALRAWAPIGTTGVLHSVSGGRQLVGFVRELVRSGDPRDALAQNAREALKTLDDGGLESAFLPAIDDGLVFVCGTEEREARLFPAFALLLPSKDPKAALEAMNGIIRKIAGGMADARMESRPVEDTTLCSWRWPDGLQINDFLRPSYAALDGAFVLGNNVSFVEALIRSAKQGGGWEESSNARNLRKRLRELGFASADPIAGGLLYPTQFRQSFDGVLPHIAKQIVGATLVPAQHRANVTRDLQQQLGRAPSDAEITKEYYLVENRLLQESEDSLRKSFRSLDALKWVAFDAAVREKGITIGVLAEFR